MTIGNFIDAAAHRIWLSAPWGRALLDFLIDPATDLDRAALPGWPDWAALDQALAVPALRRRFAQYLVADCPGAIGGVLADCAEPRGRLVLIPTAQATTLVQFAAAWWHAPQLAALLQRREVEAARQALGPEAIAFGLGAGRLLPRPTSALATAVGTAADDDADWITSGAVLYALAIGDITEATRRRIVLRRPAAIWRPLAESCHDDTVGKDAFHALHRIIREAAPVWSNWLN